MSVTRGIHRSLRIRRHALATSCDGRRRSWTEFAQRAAALAGGLRGIGIDKGERVAILMLNSDRYLECYAAVAWAGCVLVPLNSRWSERELQEAMADCQPRCLIVDAHFAALGQRIAQASAHQPLLICASDAATRISGGFDYEELIKRATPIQDENCCGEALAGLFYTGGTTGSAKGVMLTHSSVTSVATSVLVEGCFREDAVYLHAAPMFHMADGCAIYSLLTSGGASVIIPAFSPTAFFETVQSERVTESLLVPTMIQMLVDHPALGDFDLSSLRRVVYGASPMSEAVLDRAFTASAASRVHPGLWHDRSLGDRRIASCGAFDRQIPRAWAASRRRARDLWGGHRDHRRVRRGARAGPSRRGPASRPRPDGRLLAQAGGELRRHA